MLNPARTQKSFSSRKYLYARHVFTYSFIFREDHDASAMFSDEDDKDNFYSELKAAAESGWDFSTRWFIVNGTNKGRFYHLLICRE